MKTILIAEDEKFIRKGLITMVQRSPIPAETILEARDGEEALELLRQNEVDLLVTDIRMPKMDGIELVSQLGELDHQPMVLVISGYDDFSYAVEMLRNGAFDYLLKPVEREKLFAVLKKLEDQYRQKLARREERGRQLVRALRHLMLEQDADSPEWREQADRCREGFFPGPYVGFCAGGCYTPRPEGVVQLHAVGALHLCVTPEGEADTLAALLPAPVGRSGPHTGPEALPLCYREARAAWQRSFFTGTPFAAPGPEAFQPLSVTVEQLMGLAGLSRGQEAVQLLRGEGERAARGEADPEDVAALCARFAQRLGRDYGQFMAEGGEPKRFAVLWDFPSWARYLDELGQWLDGFCGRTAQEFADYENKQKIRQAAQYIQQHFREPLSMTVVSNHVSMNYSLFSLLFKQYTGVNFSGYLQELRINEAKRLLEETDWRVNEICRRAGFADDKHFLKVFKAAVGFSPTEYRRAKAPTREES